MEKKRKNLYLSVRALKLLELLADDDTGGNESLQVERLIEGRAKLKRIELAETSPSSLASSTLATGITGDIMRYNQTAAFGHIGKAK